MELAVAVLTQAVYWPLAAVVAWRAAARRVAPVAGWAVVVLLVAGAVAAWDPVSVQPYARVAIGVSNTAIAVLFAVFPDGRLAPRWIWIPMAVEVATQFANLASGLALAQLQPWCLCTIR